MNPTRRALLRSFLAIPLARRLRPPPATAVVGTTARFWCVFTHVLTASGGISKGEAVFLMPNGEVRAYRPPTLYISEGTVAVLDPGDFYPIGRAERA